MTDRLGRAARLLSPVIVTAFAVGCSPAAEIDPSLATAPMQLSLNVPTGAAPAECASVGLFTRLDGITLKRAFADDFAGPRLDPKRWSMNFASDYWWLAGTRTLPGNKEQQIYVDPGYPGRAGRGTKPLGLDPFAFDKRGLSIVARRTPEPLKPALFDFPYYSGAMTTADTFQQRYGYFEARLLLPAGGGLWSAFWLLNGSNRKAWPPEIDVIEHLGRDPSQIHMTGHYRQAGAPGAGESQCAVRRDSATDSFTNYGVLIQPARVTWYIDRQPVAQMATKPDFDAPFYMLINLAVGGVWPGAVSERTPAEARLRIAYVAAYRAAGVQ